MKAGLIELFVDLAPVDCKEGLGRAEAVCRAIRALGDDRDRVVRATVKAAKDLDCGLIVLPGWTVVADEPPAWLLKLSKGCTLIFECLWPAAGTHGKEAGRAMYVARNGEVVVGPIFQWIVEADDLWRNTTCLSPAAISLAREIAAPTPRRWNAGGALGGSLLMVCGEVNIVGDKVSGPEGHRHHHGFHHAEVLAVGLTMDGLRANGLIVNPAHTATSVEAMRVRRRWLSQGGWVLLTANTHSAWTKSTDDGPKKGAASWNAASAWRLGEDRGGDLASEYGSPGKCVVKTIDLI